MSVSSGQPAAASSNALNEYRVVVFGSAGVGKTSLIQRFVRNEFREQYTPTVEDSYRQIISCDNNVCTLEIIDTAGSRQFPAMQRLSIQSGHAFLLVYSVTMKTSMEELKSDMLMIRDVKKQLMPSTPMLLVANKSDSATREVSTKLGEEVAKTWGVGFVETSAKTNHNVREMFVKLFDLDKARKLSLQSPMEQSLSDGGKKKKKKGKEPKPTTSTEQGGAAPKKKCRLM